MIEKGRIRRKPTLSIGAEKMCVPDANLIVYV